VLLIAFKPSNSSTALNGSQKQWTTGMRAYLPLCFLHLSVIIYYKHISLSSYFIGKSYAQLLWHKRGLKLRNIKQCTLQLCC